MTKVPRTKPATAGCKKVSPPVRQTATRGDRSPTLPDDAEVAALALDLGKMIEAAWQQVAVAANAALTTLYWQLGHRVRTEVLEGRRAESGAQIVAAVGRQLETRYGRGFGPSEARSGLAGGATSVSRAARVAAPAGWTAAIITRPLAAHAPACRSASNSFPRPPSRRAPSSASWRSGFGASATSSRGRGQTSPL